MEESLSYQADKVEMSSQKAEVLIQKAASEQLTTLDLTGLMLTELPEIIGNLTQLSNLNVSNNKLTALPDWMCNLTQLSNLNVSNNQLTALPDWIDSLTKLFSLNVNSNELTSLPESIGNLTQLTRFYVNSNELTALPESIGNLMQLIHLHAYFNQLDTLPPSFANLKQLNTLVLFRNRLTTLPECIANLTNLERLDVSFNQLAALPDWLGNLKQLQELDVAQNNISVLPGWIGNLSKLTHLLFYGNQLLALPESLKLLGDLQEMDLHGNEELKIPLEILGPDWQERVEKRVCASSPRSILDFYFRTISGIQQPLNEVKLLLVGRGSAGKTSIVRRLREDKFSRGLKETKGITINNWSLPCGDDDVRVNIWDFAGQVITHSTHHFFLTQRSVYILVLTGREDSQKADADYWLRLIRAFGTDRISGETSPVIILLNKWVLSPFRVDRNALKEKYPFIIDFVETDCKTRLGIDKLKHLLSESICRMESVRKPFPASWWAIKERLETMKKSYVSYGDYRALCESLGEKDHSAHRSLSTVLHALGIALNYADDSRLRETTVLNPHWVTDCIYKLLRDGVRDDGSGEMHMSDVVRVLPKEKQEMRIFLIELMRRFDLAFPLTEDREQWLVPQRLPDEQPELDIKLDDPRGTRLKYCYSVLPEGLLPRFITRTYPLSNGLPRWMNGVVLEDDGARALVRADIIERTVSVVAYGQSDSLRRLIGLIRSDLNAIHDDIEGLNPEELIELTDKPGVYVSIQALEVDEQKNQNSAASTNEGTIPVSNTRELNKVSAPEARNPDTWKAKLFISYSSADSRYHDELGVRLKPMMSEGLLESWSDRCIIAGQPWDGVIRKELAEADLVVFLQSARFVASDYIQDIEVAQALQQEADGKSEIVSIILEECDWQKGKHGNQLKEFQALPPKAQPVRDTVPQRNAWHDVAVGLRNTIEDIRLKRSRQPNDLDSIKIAKDYRIVKSSVHRQ